MTYPLGDCSHRRAEQEVVIQRGSSARSQQPACLGAARRDDPRVQAVGEQQRGVAAQVEIESKAGKWFIMFQLQALKASALNPESTWGEAWDRPTVSSVRRKSAATARRSEGEAWMPGSGTAYPTAVMKAIHTAMPTGAPCFSHHVSGPARYCSPRHQGLTLVHFSAQRKHVL